MHIDVRYPKDARGNGELEEWAPLGRSFGDPWTLNVWLDDQPKASDACAIIGAVISTVPVARAGCLAGRQAQFTLQNA
jgi:hypothetical protein